jgi:multiple sugar transport system substrate-binding protein
MRRKLKTPLLAASLTAFLGLGLHQVQAKDITLHALMEDVPETHIIESMLPEFQKETGIKVEFQKLVYSDMHDKLVAQLTGSSSFYNVLEVDFLWAGEFPAAGWLQPLQPMVDASKFDLAPFIPSMIDLVGKNQGTLYMIPMYNYSMGLIYRTDLLQDPKLQAAYKAKYNADLAPPKTLAEYVQIASFMKDQAGVAGSAMQGQRGDPNAMEFSNYLFSSGGRYLDDQGHVALDSPEARQALTLYVSAIQHAAQKGALSATLDDTQRLMCSGAAFSFVTYWWMLPQVNDPKTCPKVAGKLAIAVMPGGHGESGGWGWGIPKNESPVLQKAAWTFIQWVQGEKISIARAMEGHAPVRSDVYQNADVLKKYPYYKEAEQVVATGMAFPVFPYSAQYEDVLGTQLSLAASNQTDVDTAVKKAASGLADLQKKAGQ